MSTKGKAGPKKLTSHQTVFDQSNCSLDELPTHNNNIRVSGKPKRGAHFRAEVKMSFPDCPNALFADAAATVVYKAYRIGGHLFKHEAKKVS